MNRTTIWPLTVALLSLSIGIARADEAVFKPSDLKLAAKSREMIWNGVTTDRGRIFVAGPRWTGSKGASVALIDAHGMPQPYPDVEWNAFKPGADPAKTFVNVNAIHLDGKGGMWVIDTGSPAFGGDPLPGGVKAVRIDLAKNKVDRVIPLGAAVAPQGSYIDDIRFNGDRAYLTDAGQPGLIVLDLRDGSARRVLNGHPSVTAIHGRDIFLSGRPLRSPDGNLLHVQSDPLEVSPEGRWLYFAPLEGPWSQIETRWLDDPTVTPEEIASKVEPFADLPPTGGTAMDSNGDLYFSDLAADAIRKRAADGTVTTVVVSPELHWVDALFIDSDHTLWMPVPQLDRAALFNNGSSGIHYPIKLFKLPLLPRPSRP